MRKPLSLSRKTIDALIETRRRLAADIEDIDAELSRQGVRVAAKPAGRVRDTAILVLKALAKGPLDSDAIAKATGQSKHATDQMLSKMTLAGELRRLSRGIYSL